MPVKIRCRGCQKVLSAPDKARGKAIQCPNCQTKIKVPGGAAGATAGKRPAKKPRTKSREEDAEGFFAGLDLSQQEHEEEQVCPYCAADMELEEVVCRSCGMNIETGQMDAREKKKRARKGPDPALFYSKAWSDSLAFVKEHWGLALKTGWNFAFIAILHNICAFMLWYCQTTPPKIFWGALTLLTALGMFGWFWSLSFKVIEATMHNEEKELERINFDLFTVIALGVRLVLWPIVVMVPPAPLPLAYLAVFSLIFLMFAGLFAPEYGEVVTGFFIGNVTAFGIFILVSLPFLLWFYPIATVHMTQKYQYKAWIFWELIKIGVRNVPPAFYFFVVSFAVVLPLVIFLLPIGLILGDNANPLLSSNVNWVTNGITSWTLELFGERSDPERWLYKLILIPLNLIALGLILTPFYLISGFPALFVMRVNGLLGHYNRERLGLVNRIYPNTPATFWVRFLAHQIDLGLWWFASLLVFKEKIVAIIGWLLNAILTISAMFLPILIPFLWPIWQIYMFWWYFAVSEGTVLRTTIGKDAFGLIVSDLNDKQIPMSKATLRVMGRLVCVPLTFGIGYLMAAFHPQKRGLHDLIAGTKVVWRGDR